MFTDFIKFVSIIPVPYTDTKALEFARKLKCEMCGECCRTLKVYITEKERKEIARFLKIKVKKVPKILVPPCPYLKNNKCSIYEVRPLGCRTFPVYPHEQGMAIFRDCPKGDLLFWDLFH